MRRSVKWLAEAEQQIIFKPPHGVEYINITTLNLYFLLGNQISIQSFLSTTPAFNSVLQQI
jgi:hypothetical protein